MEVRIPQSGTICVGMALTREDILDAVRQLQEDDDLLLEAARALLDARVLRKLATRAPDVFDTLRRFILTEELLQLPAEFREFRQQVNERFDRLERETRERFDRLEGDLAGFKQETRERFDRLEARQDRLEASVDSISKWVQGERARRDGLDYQRRVIKRAWRTFGGGEGGCPDENPEVAYQIDQWLAAAGIDGNTLDPRSDPQEADLVWWKGRKVAVVEISLKVNGDDVERARLRADTLRQAGLDAIPFVIGAEWAHPETPENARELGVEWRIGSEISDGVREFHAYTP
jgi:BMFP domain-containing protein YqiC